MIRLAALGMFHEANSFSPLPATFDEFAAAGIYIGHDIVREHAGAQTSMSGFLEYGEADGVEVLPLWFAAITPMGEITADAYSRICAQLLHHLEANGPFDGVLLALHGAAVAEGEDDADGGIIARVREAIGPDVPIGVAVDMHANLTPRMVELSDVITAYQTNPHVDPRARAHDAARLVASCLAGEVSLAQRAVWLPIIPTINRMGTSEEPMRSLLESKARLAATPGVLDISLIQGHGPVNADQFGTSVVVVTDGDEDLAAEVAEALAAQVWAARADLVAPVASIAEGLATLQSGGPRPMLLLDTGDNIGGGASGDSVALLEPLLTQRMGPVLALIVAPGAASAAHAAGVGGRLSMRVGSRATAADGQLQINGRVRSLHEGRYEERSTTTHAGFRYFDAGPTAAIDLDDGSTVVVTTTAVMPTSAEQVRVLGVDPAAYQLIVAKGVHSPLTGYGRYAAGKLIVDTPGPTAVDYRLHPYTRRPRPMIPFENDVDRSLAVTSAV